MAKKQCAVCLDKTQANVVMKWIRHADGQVFNVCLHCAEQGKVSEDTVHQYVTRSFTTVAQRGVS